MKSFLLCTLLLISCTAFSQLKKGAVLVEGSGNFNINKSSSEQASSGLTSESKNTSFTLSPRIGFLVSEGVLVGFALSYQYSSQKSESMNLNQESTQKSNQFSLGGYLRKYVKLNEKFYFTGTLNISGGFGKVKNTYDYGFGFEDEKTETTLYNASASITPGLTYFISNKWAVTATIGQLYTNLTWYKPKEDNAVKSHSVSGGLNFQLNTFGFGVQYFLRNAEE